MYKLFAIIQVLLYWCLWKPPVKAQCPADSVFLNSLQNIEGNTTVADTLNLKSLLDLQQSYSKCHPVKDSIYARIVHRAGGIYSKIGEIEKAISFTEEAVDVNKNENYGAVSFLANSYFNLGTFYNRIYNYENAHRLLNKCIDISKQFPAKYFLAFMAYEQNAYLYFQTGDYEKTIETADDGILFAKKINAIPDEGALLCQKVQAQIELNDFKKAEENIRKAISKFSENEMHTSRLATAYAVYAQLLKANGTFKTAVQYYKESFKLNEIAGNWVQCSRDMLNLGYLYDCNLNDTSKALLAYEKGLKMVGKSSDDYQKAGLYINIGFLYSRRKNYDEALHFYQKALLSLPIHFTNNSVKSNPSLKMLMLVSNDYFVSTLLSNKAEALLDLYKIKKDKTLLKTALETFSLADQAVDYMRWKQFGEQSKLHWREETNKMYEHAIEACYLANDVKLAFFFMEKSRAVLLNDKLNELGAFARLPQHELTKENKLRMEIVNAQQNWTSSVGNVKEAEKMQAKLLAAKTNFENYIKALEQKYPAYYQYKYSSKVPELNALSKYLSRENAAFVHYFTNDSVTYMLKITAENTAFIKYNKAQFDQAKIRAFMQMCSEKQTLINHYANFASLSNELYQILFQPLELKQEKVIICADNFLIPFEALCKDKNGKQFLLNDYVFDYVYSAGYLLKDFRIISAKANFIGFSPVQYQANLHVSDLKNADKSLKKAAEFFYRTRLFSGEEASKRSFINNIENYNIVTVFSHASADKNGNEPLLFMQDSVIRLSELQLLKHTVATRLVILSACETNAGKSAAGEGIYSLARGFTAAGIPSIAATLWEADEQAIYDITINFNQYLAKGLSKDKALQKAKIDFITQNNFEKSLPYYWANMILIGNPEPVDLIPLINFWWFGLGFLILILIVGFIYLKRIRSQKNKSQIYVPVFK